MYRVIGGEKRLSDGWSTASITPLSRSSPSSTPDRAYLMAMLVVTGDGERDALHAVIPIYEPSRIWTRIWPPSAPHGGRRPSPVG